MSAEVPEPWQLRAACRPGSGHDPDWWFPNKGDDDTRAHALRICRLCPVRTNCAQHALKVGASDGIWGGLTQNQLSRLTGTRAAERRVLATQEGLR